MRLISRIERLEHWRPPELPMLILSPEFEAHLDEVERAAIAEHPEIATMNLDDRARAIAKFYDEVPEEQWPACVRMREQKNAAAENPSGAGVQIGGCA